MRLQDLSSDATAARIAERMQSQPEHQADTGLGVRQGRGSVSLSQSRDQGEVCMSCWGEPRGRAATAASGVVVRLQEGQRGGSGVERGGLQRSRRKRVSWAQKNKQNRRKIGRMCTGGVVCVGRRLVTSMFCVDPIRLGR